MHVHVGAESRVVGEIPTIVIRIVVDNDVIVVPIPIVNVAEIEGSYAEVVSAEPEAAGSSAAQAPDVTRSDSTLEAAMLPGVFKMESGIATALGVADPLVILVDVRSVGVRGFIAIGSARLVFLVWAGGLFARRRFPLRCSLGRAASRGRTARRNVSAANAVAASVAASCVMLRPCRQGKGQK